LPPGAPRRYRDVFTGATLTARARGDGATEEASATLQAADVFGLFPVALLVGEHDA
jgi:hypothetical protein